MNDKIYKLTPLVTEKSSMEISKNKYTFITDKSVNKINFSKFIESHFNVKVTSVNVLNQKPKKRRRGRITGRDSCKKKRS